MRSAGRPRETVASNYAIEPPARRRLIANVGAAASRRANGAAYSHPLSVRRFAPANQRLQRTAGPASKLARPSAADPRPRWAKGGTRWR